MDLTVFQYITEIPEFVTEQDYYRLAVYGYNLGLTLVWLLLAMYLIDKLFVCFRFLYSKRHD